MLLSQLYMVIWSLDFGFVFGGELTENSDVAAVSDIALWKPYGAAHPVHGSFRLFDLICKKFVTQECCWWFTNKFDSMMLIYRWLINGRDNRWRNRVSIPNERRIPTRLCSATNVLCLRCFGSNSNVYRSRSVHTCASTSPKQITDTYTNNTEKRAEIR